MAAAAMRIMINWQHELSVAVCAMATGACQDFKLSGIRHDPFGFQVNCMIQFDRRAIGLMQPEYGKFRVVGCERVDVRFSLRCT